MVDQRRVVLRDAESVSERAGSRCLGIFLDSRPDLLGALTTLQPLNYSRARKLERQHRRVDFELCALCCHVSLGVSKSPVPRPSTRPSVLG